MQHHLQCHKHPKERLQGHNLSDLDIHTRPKPLTTNCTPHTPSNVPCVTNLGQRFQNATSTVLALFSTNTCGSFHSTKNANRHHMHTRCSNDIHFCKRVGGLGDAGGAGAFPAAVPPWGGFILANCAIMFASGSPAAGGGGNDGGADDCGWGKAAGLRAPPMSACMNWRCWSSDQTEGLGWAIKAGGEGDGLGVSFGGRGGGMLISSPTNASLSLLGASTTTSGQKKKQGGADELTTADVRWRIFAAR